MVKVTGDSVLVLIDVQAAWNDPVWGKRNNPEAEEKMSIVLRKFREHNLRVIHVRHDSRNPKSLLREGKPGFEFKKEVAPLKGETIITKHVNSALIGTDLDKLLREMGNPSVYFAGLTTDHCVSTSARMAGNLGYRTFVIGDACATFERRGKIGGMIPADMVHQVNLASIDGEFAEVVNSGELEFQ